eukprot:gene9901-10058_t
MRPSQAEPTAEEEARAAAVESAATALTGNAITTGLAAVQSQDPGLNGTGTLICVVDTGINYKLELFGACTSLNAPVGRCRVVTGLDFVGDEYNGTTFGPPAVRGGTPLDCMGHGTMVASVAATSNGVAAGALLGSYRVFGCDGYATDDIIIEAIDRAVRDGCDVINLSLSSGAGYADNSVFKPVMENAISKGVMVVKAAGNSGRDGPFNADVATAAGSITAASVGSGSGDPIDTRLVASRFSSYGPAASLELTPHLSAPGAFITVRTQENSTTRASGTSFSSPYISGSLAIWLQQQREAAARRNVAGAPLLGAVVAGQDAALRGLVATAAAVPDEDNSSFLEPLAKVGAGVLQVDALLQNQLSVSPMMVQLPSSLTDASTINITLTWRGAPHPAGKVAYQLKHEPAASMTVSNGWYGTAASIRKVYETADVVFSPAQVVMDTTDGQSAVVQVNFTLPPALTSQQLLYSGIIRLRPNKQNSLCYAPYSKPVFVNSIMDSQAEVPGVCTGGFSNNDSADPLNVSLSVLKASPECSLRVTLVPEVPARMLYMLVLDSASNLLGSMAPLDPSSGSSLASQGEVWSWCLRFNGSYKDTLGRLSWLTVGQTYRLRALLQGPLSAADAAAGFMAEKHKVSYVPL